jgi:Tol biopolymer transport system component
MTASDRLDQRATELLVELAAPNYPDYFDDVLERAIDRPQRPAWTFPERWLPMGVIARRVAPAPALPWPTIGILALLVVLLATALAVGLGSQRQLAPPYGLASNGDVAYAYNGDIYIGDPANPDASRAVITGPEEDVVPFFSRDGSRLAWFRVEEADGPAERLFVANADGTDPRVVAGGDKMITATWSPDSQELAVVVEHALRPGLEIVPADRSPSRTIDLEVEPTEQLDWLPPAGERLYFTGLIGGTPGIYSIKADGSDFQQVPLTGDFTGLSMMLSPTGDRLLYTTFPSDPNRVHIRSVDLGTGVDTEFGLAMPAPAADVGVGPLHAGFPRFSPDGSRIVYGRYWDEHDGQINHQVWTASVASDGADAVPVGDVHRSRSGHGPFDYTFSPDGTSLLVQFNEVPVTWLSSSEGGATETIPWGAISYVPDWQRRR